MARGFPPGRPRKTQRNDGAGKAVAAHVDAHHVRHERLGRAAVHVVQVQARAQVEQLDEGEALRGRERLVLALVLADARAQLEQRPLLVLPFEVGRRAHLLQQIDLDRLHVVANALDEQHLHLRELGAQHVDHVGAPEFIRVGRVKDRGPPNVAVPLARAQPVDHLVQHALRDFVANLHVRLAEELRVLLRGTRRAAPVADVEDSRRVAAPAQKPLQLLRDEALAARGQPDHHEHEALSVRREHVPARLRVHLRGRPFHDRAVRVARGVADVRHGEDGARRGASSVGGFAGGLSFRRSARTPHQIRFQHLGGCAWTGKGCTP